MFRMIFAALMMVAVVTPAAAQVSSPWQVPQTRQQQVYQNDWQYRGRYNGAPVQQQSQFGSKATWGTLLGGVLGGVGGSQIGKGNGKTAATIAGTLLGAVVGNSIGQSLDRADQIALQEARMQVLTQPDIRQPIGWNNQNSGVQGQVIATREGVHTQTGEYCREYQTTVTVGGQQQSAYGIACRMADNTWRLIN